jgi:hypothetical protein
MTTMIPLIIAIVISSTTVLARAPGTAYHTDHSHNIPINQSDIFFLDPEIKEWYDHLTITITVVAFVHYFFYLFFSNLHRFVVGIIILIGIKIMLILVLQQCHSVLLYRYILTTFLATAAASFGLTNCSAISVPIGRN